MNTCKNCDLWTPMGGNYGKCRFVVVTGSDCISLGPLPHGKAAITHGEDFGCIYFVEKRKGPFSIHKGNDRHFNIMHCGNFGPPFLHRKTAQVLASWLNDLWAQRDETNPMKSCGNCGADETCFYMHSTELERCSKWSPK